MMKSSLPNLPVLKSLPVQMEAVHYNNVFLALRRNEAPLKLVLPGMRGFEVRLQWDAWICVDRTFNNQALLAWSGFRPSARSGLYEPVPCHVLFYHPFAAFLQRTLPDEINRVLLKRLNRGLEPLAAQVIPF